MKISFRSIVCFSLIALLIIVMYMNVSSSREGWTPKNGKDYYKINYADAENDSCEMWVNYPYRVVGTDTNGKQRIRCYEKPGRKPK
jgi:hypothetical protein